MCLFSLFCLSKPAFCLSGFFYFHIYYMLFEVKGQGWVSSLPGLVCVCAAGDRGLYPDKTFFASHGMKAVRRLRGPTNTEESRKRTWSTQEHRLGHVLCCAVLCSVAGSKVCRAGIHFWRLSNLKLLKIFHWPLSDDLLSKWRVALRCCPQTSLYRFGLGVLERTGN